MKCAGVWWGRQYGALILRSQDPLDVYYLCMAHEQPLSAYLHIFPKFLTLWLELSGLHIPTKLCIVYRFNIKVVSVIPTLFESRGIYHSGASLGSRVNSRSAKTGSDNLEAEAGRSQVQSHCGGIEWRLSQKKRRRQKSIVPSVAEYNQSLLTRALCDLPGRNEDLLNRHLCLSIWPSDCFNHGPQGNGNFSR